MADFHAADLWVAVVPETSQVGPAMEQAGKEAKGKFGDAVKGIGKNIHDEFDKIGQKAKDAFGKAGKTAGEVFSSEIGKELTNTAGAEIGKALGEAVKELPGVAKGVELFHNWADASVQAHAGIKSVADAMQSAKAGDFAGALNGVDQTLRNVEPIAKVFGADISGWKVPDPLTEGLAKVDNTSKDLVKNFADAKGGVDRLGQSGGGLSGLIGKLGEVSVIATAVVATLNSIKDADHWLEDKMPWYKNLDEQWKDNPINKFFHDHLGGGGSGPDNSPLPPGVTRGSDGSLISSGGGHPWDNDPWFFPDKSSPNKSSPWANSPYFGHGSASHSGNWDAIAGPEAGGNWQIDHGEGPDVTGGLQIATQTWLANGGGAFAPKAYMATSEQQKTIADRILATQGPGAWPTTSKNHPDWFKGGSGSGGGGGGLPSGGLPNVRGAHPQLAYALAAAKQMFPDLQLTAGKDDHPMDQGWHPRGQAIDIGGGTPQEQAAFSNYLLQFAPSIEELIHSGPGVTQNIKSGRVGPAIDMPGSVYNSGQAGYHGDHVHLAVKDEMAQAFEAALGGGGLQAPGLNGRGPNGQIPTGAEHDPLYVMPASSGTGGSGGGSSPFQSQGQQLGQGLLGGLMQSLGLDGSVFGGKSPMDWGAVKLGGGLLNYGMGLMNSMSGGGPMGTPGGGGGGGGGLLGGLSGLIPGAGAAISAAAGPGGGSFGIRNAVGGGPVSIHHDNSVTVAGPFNAARDGLQEAQWAQNANRNNPNRSNSYLSNVPTPG